MRCELRRLLMKCTDEQVAFFNRMYKSVEVIPVEKMEWAIKQCERTIAKNEEPLKLRRRDERTNHKSSNS